MGNRFASGKIAIAECDRCGQQYQLKTLKTEIIKQRKYQLLVCAECWDPDQPQLMLGTFPVDDPQALRDPRPDFNEFPQERARLQQIRLRRLRWQSSHNRLRHLTDHALLLYFAHVQLHRHQHEAELLGWIVIHERGRNILKAPLQQRIFQGRVTADIDDLHRRRRRASGAASAAHIVRGD